MIEYGHGQRSTGLPSREKLAAINGLLAEMRRESHDCELCRAARASVVSTGKGRRARLICTTCAGTPVTAREAAPKPLRPYKPLFHRAPAPTPAAPFVGTMTRPMPFRAGRR